MDRIELANKRYRQILPDPSTVLTRAKVHELVTWLQDSVVPVAAEFIARPSFRERAVWPIWAYRRGHDSGVRERVDQMSDTVVRQAQRLRSAFDSRGVADAGRGPGPVNQEVIESVGIVSGTPHTIRRSVGEPDQFAPLVKLLETIALPFWQDLVNPEDYFGPVGPWFMRRGVDPPDIGLLPSVNTEQHAIGDFVSRALLRRVDILASTLRKIGSIVTDSVRAKELNPAGQVLVSLKNDSIGLKHLYTDLRLACWPDREGTIRDSCTVLAQIYIAFHPFPDISWIGLPEYIVEDGRRRIGLAATNQHSTELFDRVAVALGDLHRLHDIDRPIQSTFEEAIVRGGLVLSPTVVHWEGQMIEAEWTRLRRPWELLVELARCGRIGRDVLERDLFAGETPSDSAMANLMARLKSVLPVTLKKLIIPGSEPRSYRLQLEPSKITLTDNLVGRMGQPGR